MSDRIAVMNKGLVEQAASPQGDLRGAGDGVRGRLPRRLEPARRRGDRERGRGVRGPDRRPRVPLPPGRARRARRRQGDDPPRADRDRAARRGRRRAPAGHRRALRLPRRLARGPRARARRRAAARRWSPTTGAALGVSIEPGAAVSLHLPPEALRVLRPSESATEQAEAEEETLTVARRRTSRSRRPPRPARRPDGIRPAARGAASPHGPHTPRLRRRPRRRRRRRPRVGLLRRALRPHVGLLDRRARRRPLDHRLPQRRVLPAPGGRARGRRPPARVLDHHHPLVPPRRAAVAAARRGAVPRGLRPAAAERWDERPRPARPRRAAPGRREAARRLVPGRVRRRRAPRLGHRLPDGGGQGRLRPRAAHEARAGSARSPRPASTGPR